MKKNVVTRNKEQHKLKMRRLEQQKVDNGTDANCNPNYNDVWMGSQRVLRGRKGNLGRSEIDKGKEKEKMFL